jgi:3-hydroxyacyl-CoA dehydrogenase/enoyl-CoA hydratase/3-hydroxybutyryl-CoA epimerase
MSTYRTLQLTRDDQNVVTVWLDVPGMPVNIINADVMADLDAMLNQLERDKSVALVMLRSSKDSGFLAGADVNAIAGLSDPSEAREIVARGQKLFNRLAALPMPTVAVIHGNCLGGGLEMSLACDYRFALDDPRTKLGLPETQLGIIPGWGGTQRLPRLIGQSEALSMILEAKRVSAREALGSGLVDAIAAPELFEERLAEFIQARRSHQSVSRRKGSCYQRMLDRNALGRWIVRRVVERKIGQRATHYPALAAAMRAVSVGLREGIEQGLQAEQDEFVRLIGMPSCKNLIQLFLQRERARKAETWVSRDTPSERVTRVAVIGGGVMGAGIAQAALVSGSSVVIKELNSDLAEAGRKRVQDLFTSAQKKGVFTAADVDRHVSRLTVTDTWNDLADCDLAIEAVVERMDIKQKVFSELDRVLKPTAVIASNTSALPIHTMARDGEHGERVAGLHFFNPVHRMPLVEVVRTETTNEATIATLVNFVRGLGKVPIVVNEGPGFLVNRILFPYMDEAVRLVEEGVPVEEIDRAARQFGMPMGPLELLDTVGLDVAADVAETLLVGPADDIPTPERLKAMVSAGHLGRKSGRGFYEYGSGKPKPADLKIASNGANALRLPNAVAIEPGDTLSGLQQRLLLPLVNEAAACLGDGVVGEAWMVDLGMVLGTGFAPFRGGPLKLADTWGVPRVVATLEQLSDECGPRFRPTEALRTAATAGRSISGAHPTGSSNQEERGRSKQNI